MQQTKQSGLTNGFFIKTIGLERKKICESHFLFFVKTNGKYKNYICEIMEIEIQIRILKGLGLNVAQLEIRVVI